MIVQRAEHVDDLIALDEERRQVLSGFLRRPEAIFAAISAPARP